MGKGGITPDGVRRALRSAPVMDREDNAEAKISAEQNSRIALPLHERRCSAALGKGAKNDVNLPPH